MPGALQVFFGEVIGGLLCGWLWRRVLGFVGFRGSPIAFFLPCFWMVPEIFSGREVIAAFVFPVAFAHFGSQGVSGFYIHIPGEFVGFMAGGAGVAGAPAPVGFQ